MTQSSTARGQPDTSPGSGNKHGKYKLQRRMSVPLYKTYRIHKLQRPLTMKLHLQQGREGGREGRREDGETFSVLSKPENWTYSD